MLKKFLLSIPSAVLLGVVYTLGLAFPEYKVVIESILIGLGVASPTLLLAKSPLEK